MNTPENLALLRAVVAAKLTYWDALNALEFALGPGDGFTEKANDGVIEQVDLLAAGLDRPGDIDLVTVDHLADTIRLAGAA